MALFNRLDALCAPAAGPSRRPSDDVGDSCDFNDFEAELQRLAAVNRELLGDAHADQREPGAAAEADAEELTSLRSENAELKARIQELEALASGQGEELWLERQREYEMLLEEKSDVIRGLHQKIQEAQESVQFDAVAPASTATSSTRLGQAEEILRLKRELEEQRRQLEQDEQDMMTQMRNMEMQMAKERAEMGRQRQELQRQQTELAREIENAGRDPELKERLKGLRRIESKATLAAPTAESPSLQDEKKSGGFLRRIFG